MVKGRIAFTGYAQHGKDTAADYLVSQYGFNKLAFADAVRKQLYLLDPPIPCKDNGWCSLAGQVDALGWEEVKKEPVVRRLLQRLATEAGREFFGQDIWSNTVKDIILTQYADKPVVISDLRFPNEAKMLKELGFTIYRVTRPGYDNGVGTAHASEKFIQDLPVNCELFNSSSLEEFYIQLSKLSGL